MPLHKYSEFQLLLKIIGNVETSRGLYSPRQLGFDSSFPGPRRQAPEFPTLFDPTDCSTTGSSVLLYFLDFASFMSIESVMPSNLCHPLLLLPSIFPSIRVFYKKLTLHIRWLRYWSFSFSISLSNEYSELISFRIDWFDLFNVQGTLKSLLQHHNSKTSILWPSAFGL